MDRQPLSGLTRQTSDDGYVATLPGYRRTWGVAMDNSKDIPGYKFYRDEDGHRAVGCVAFLDIQEDANARVNGVCLPVTAVTKDELCLRERNYELLDVTDGITPPPPAGCRVFVFAGLSESRARANAARESGALLIQREYVDNVEAHFARLGESEISDYRASTESTDAGGLRVERLRRVDIPKTDADGVTRSR